MQKIFAAVAISLAAGFALGAWVADDEQIADVDSSAALPVSQFDPAAPLEERLLSLEQVLAEERQSRILLMEQVDELTAAIERIDAAGPRFIAERSAREDELRERRRQEQGQSRDVASAMQNFQDRRLGRLVDGGFSEEEARRVLRQESEAQYKAMQAAWEAQRSGEQLDPFRAMGSPQSQLRADLGDNAYERYLEAQGAPTSVQITQVLDGSPGSHAGLQPGDEIVSYNGDRVFNVMELRNLTMQGRPGEDVIVEVNRDGMTMQLSLPRGPVGISGSSAGVRNMNWWGGG